MGKILFVIPARSGSKGLKDKNILNCANETLLRRSIKVCKDIGGDSNIYVSTDSNKYISHVDDLISNPPYLRPKYLSGDLVGDIEVLTHALHVCENFYDTNYQCIVMIQPTCPLRKKEHIIDSIKAVIDEKFDTAITCNKVDKKYHPLKSLSINNKNYLTPYLETSVEIIARQQLNDTYIRNGACYAITPKQLCVGKSFFNCKSKLIQTEPLISIDTHEELKYCEAILTKRLSETQSS